MENSANKFRKHAALRVAYKSRSAVKMLDLLPDIILFDRLNFGAIYSMSTLEISRGEIWNGFRSEFKKFPSRIFPRQSVSLWCDGGALEFPRNDNKISRSIELR